jgi:hypothetical protein
MSSQVEIREAAASRRSRIMVLSVLHALVYAASLSGCGGGGGGGDTTDQTKTVSAPAPAPAPTQSAFPGQNVSGSGTGSSNSSTSVGLGISFTLPAARTTSAGVYAADGRLVRTLWRGQRMAAGAHTASWDQRDDVGTLLPDGSYTVKVLHHDVQYVWEGAIGNTSATVGAAVLHRSYRHPTSFAAISGGMLYAVGYNEAQSAINGFRLANPQLNASPVRHVDMYVSPDLIAADGHRVYWANTGLGMSKATFVTAQELSDGSQSAFSAGAPACLAYKADGTSCYADQTYASVLDMRSDNLRPATGLAVQASGNILAVAYGSTNEIHLFDKTTGQLLRTLSVTLNPNALNQIAMSPAGDLWVITGNAVVRYTGLATTPSIAATITSLVKPLAVAVDPRDDDSVWIADGGTSQQVKRFDAVGTAHQAIGRAGGGTSQTLVSDDRMNFTLSPGRERTALAVDDTHAVWVLDTATNRMLKFAADGTPSDQIDYLVTSYTTPVDTGNPTRVFANFMEFRVDYGKSLSDRSSWTLVRNWLPALPADLQVAEGGTQDYVSANWGWAGFRTVVTLGNGRTYALLGMQERNAFVELAADGSLRFIRWLRDAGDGETRVVLYENGDLGWSSSDGVTQRVLRQQLQGFDAAGNPVWASTPSVIAAAPAGIATPADPPLTYTGVVGARFPVTDSGKVVYFNPAVDAATAYHLGAVALGGTSWNFQASPSGPLDGLGTYQTRKDDPTLQYGGDLVHALGNDIVYGYHGEYYTDLTNGKMGQANQFMHFREDGLFVGEFGVQSTRATMASQPGASGNAFSSTLLRYGGQTYLYHNDESTFAGIQRWRLAGIDDIQELAASGTRGAEITLK